MPEAQDPVVMAEKEKASAAGLSSALMKRAIDGAIRRQATAWGIRFDQAQALLLDRKVVA